MSTQIATRAQIDDVLGDGRSRFFGAGYRRVRQLLNTVECPDGETGLTTPILHYPADWSVKADSEPRVPHLSTIDGIALGIRTAAGLAVKRERTLGRTVRAAHLVRLKLKAGDAPDEVLDAIPIRVGFTGELAESVQCFLVEVGGMRVEVALKIASQHSTSRTAVPIRSDDLVAGFDPRYWENEVLIEDIDLDMEHLVATANVSVSKVGLCGSVLVPVSVVEAVVVLAQLSQALMYRLDGLNRGTSETLWMRWTEIVTSPHPSVLASGVVGSRLEIQRAQKLTMNGHQWRTTRVLGNVAGFVVISALAHQLPD